MMPARSRSAGVTAAATLAVLGSARVAFFLWGWFSPSSDERSAGLSNGSTRVVKFIPLRVVR